MYLLSVSFYVYMFVVSVNCKTFSQCDGQQHGAYISGESGCDSFIFCSGDNSFDGSCPTGHRFNPNDNTCEELENGVCEDETIIPTTKVPKKKVICPPASTSRDVFYVASEDSCSDYYACYKGESSLMYCPESFHFSVTKQACLPPKLADCKISDVTISPSSSKKPRPVPTRKPMTKKPEISELSSPSKKPTPGVPMPTKIQKTKPSKTTFPTVSSTESEINIFELPTPQSGSVEEDKPKRPPVPIKKPFRKDSSTRKTTKLIPTTVSIVEDFPTESTEIFIETDDDVFSSEEIYALSFIPALSSSSTKSSILTNDREKIIKDRCSKQGVGYFEYPDNCHFYYRCINKKLYKEECPNGYGWDVQNKTCTASACKNQN